MLKKLTELTGLTSIKSDPNKAVGRGSSPENVALYRGILWKLAESETNRFFYDYLIKL